MKIHNAIVSLTIIGLAGALAGCAHCKSQPSKQPVQQKAVAVLYPTKGQKVNGAVTFTQTDKGVRIVADVEGLTPGVHGFHVHEYGDCSAPDATTAGGHFNPTGEPHCAPECAQRHVGDLGNLIADENGKAHYDRVDNELAFVGSNSIIGRSVIVHEKPDDLKTQPTGNAGPRAACGVIGVAK